MISLFFQITTRGLGSNQSCVFTVNICLLLTRLVELKSKRYRQISCLTTKFPFLNFKVFYGVSTSIVLRLLKKLRTLISSFTRMFWMLKLPLSTETLHFFQKLVFVNPFEYQWVNFFAGEIMIFLTIEGSDLSGKSLVPVTLRLLEALWLKIFNSTLEENTNLVEDFVISMLEIYIFTPFH